MQTPIYNLVPNVIALLKEYGNIIAHFHYKIEDYINQGPDNDNMKIKKKMLIYYVYTTIIYFICLPFFSSSASIGHSILYGCLALFQVFMVKIKNYYVLVSYFVIYICFFIYLPATKEDECLKAIGIALMQHNIFFLFPDSTMLKLSYIFLSVIFLKNTQCSFSSLMKQREFGVIEAMIENFSSTWPIIYVMNHVNSMYLLGAFQRSMRENKIIKDQFKEANKKLIDHDKFRMAFSMLEKTNLELNNALKARELFIASVSHELRNPLNSMIGNIELVRLDTIDPKLSKMLEVCKICGEVLLALINNVLDMAKINAEKLELHYLPGSFLKLVEKVWGISTLKMKQKNLKGELYLSNDFPKYIEMDSHRFMQILLNILGNSVKFTSQGFIKVVVTWHETIDFEGLNRPHEDYLKMTYKALIQPQEEPKKRVSYSPEAKDPANTEKLSKEGERNTNLTQEITCRNLYPKFISHMLASRCSHLNIDSFHLPKVKSPKRNNYQKRQGIIKIEIIDTGCGISSAALQNLFKPFCQADSSISRRFGGTGLGLYITEQLILKMRGQIQVYSQEGVGSNFCMLIPATTATKEEVNAKACDEGEDSPDFKKLAAQMRVLVVEDDPFNRSILSGYYKKLNMQVETATNGEEGLAIFIQRGKDYYSFVSSDLQMPLMDGFTMCRNMRKYEQQNGVKRNIPIVVVTGNCTNAERMECLDPSGGIRAVGFYRKPFTFKDCKMATKSVIYKRRVSDSEKIKVLVVDDDPFNTTLLQQFLQKNGFQCDACNSGKDAIEMVCGVRYNAILMDCEMPEMDGYTTARLLKEKYPEILIIGISGNSGEAHTAKCRRSGMNKVETKPVDFKRLVSMLLKEASY